MNFPIYRKLVDTEGVRNGFPSLQHYKLLDEKTSISVRQDNVIGIGIAENMDPGVVDHFINGFEPSSEVEFNAALDGVRPQLLLLLQ